MTEATGVEPAEVDPTEVTEVESLAPKPARGSSRLRAVLGALGTGVMSALLVALIGVGVAAIVVPALTGSMALTVRTSSMEPTLPAGTMVVVRPTAIEDIAPGMVLTYQLKSGEPTLVTHRVTQQMTLADGSPIFITKGDANPQPDATPVKPVQVKGTVWYAIPWIGWLANLLTGDMRAIVVSVLVGGLLVYASFMFISAARDRLRRRRSDLRGEGPTTDGSSRVRRPKHG